MVNNVPTNVRPTPLMVKRRQERGSRNLILAEGVGESFPVVSLRGGKWHIKWQGEETLLEDARGRPLQEISVVILDAGPISKQWFESQYVNEKVSHGRAPDCFSMNGVKPESQSPKPQSATCAPCPHNIWGSAGRENKATVEGKGRGKACSDGRRLALMLPPGMVAGREKEITPALLRIPPTSLKPLKNYGRELDGMGLDFDMVVTTMSFAGDATQPVVVFERESVLSEEEYQVVIDTAETDDSVKRMIWAPVTSVTAEPDEPDVTIEPEKKYTSFTRRGLPDEPEAAPAPAPQPKPSPAPAAQAKAWPPANVMQLKNGQWVDKETGDFVEPPKDEAPPANLKQLKNGQWVDLDTGEFVEVSGQKQAEPEIIPPGEKPSFLARGAKTPEEATDVTPAKAKRAARKKAAEAEDGEQAQGEATPANGTGESVPSSQGLLDVLSGMFPKN
jgi:hypothetical protein